MCDVNMKCMFYFSLAMSGVQFRILICTTTDFTRFYATDGVSAAFWSRQDRVSVLQRVQSWIQPRRGPRIMSR
jgi:hypothetical protein